MRLVIEGAPRTKKNHQRIARRTDGTPFVLQSRDAVDWASRAAEQLREQWAGAPPIDAEVRVRALVYREKAIGDLCGYLQAIGDVLEAETEQARKKRLAKKRPKPPSKAAVLVNDRQIASWDGSRLLKDKHKPRVELEIEYLTEGGAP